MIEAHVLEAALRKPLCKCQRCDKQLYVGSTGNFHVDPATKEWVGVCYACLRPEED